METDFEHFLEINPDASLFRSRGLTFTAIGDTRPKGIKAISTTAWNRQGEKVAHVSTDFRPSENRANVVVGELSITGLPEAVNAVTTAIAITALEATSLIRDLNGIKVSLWSIPKDSKEPLETSLGVVNGQVTKINFLDSRHIGKMGIRRIK